MSIHRPIGIVLGFVLTLAVGNGSANAQEIEKPARAALGVWDTGKSAAEPLTPEAVEQKSGWKALESSDTAPAFQGDAAIANGRLLAVARKQGTGVEVYSLGSGKPIFRTPSASGPRRGHRSGHAHGKQPGGRRPRNGVESRTLCRFRIKKGDHFVETAGSSPVRRRCGSSARAASPSCRTSSRTTSCSTHARFRSTRSNCPARTSCSISRASRTRS